MQADQVAVVKVVAGDSEHYETAIYKGIVETAYKGTKAGDVIFFGPYLGREIGGEYVLFLKKGAGEVPSVPGGLTFGELKAVDREMYEGYATFSMGYECIFGVAGSAQQCDYSVQLNPEQIVLPQDIKTFPRGDANAVTNYKKWVRRSTFEAELRMLAERPRARG